MKTIYILGMLEALVALLLVAFWLGLRKRYQELHAPAKAMAEGKRQWWRSLKGMPVPGTAAFTILSALNGGGCLGRSKPEEPVFVLVARDKAASKVVRYWAALVGPMGGNPEKVADARHIADLMDQWRAAHGGKVPD
jgi:hypothetical protein